MQEQAARVTKSPSSMDVKEEVKNGTCKVKRETTMRGTQKVKEESESGKVKGVKGESKEHAKEEVKDEVKEARMPSGTLIPFFGGFRFPYKPL